MLTKFQIDWKILRLFLSSMFAFGLWIGSAQASVIFDTNPFPIVDPFGISPFWEWRTIETDHFRLNFPQELSPIAQKAARYLEEAHTLLSPFLLWTPQAKTNVLLMDNQDQANGLTAPAARIGIILWAALPFSESENAFYDDWLRLLVIHEYTHFLNMDPTRGIWKPLRLVFGDSLLPNAILPPWMLEGLAVNAETRFTAAGRGRSSFYEMVLRAAILEKTLNTDHFVTLDRVHGENPYYPGGNTRYIFGYYLTREVSFEKMGILSYNSSYRIPFFINGNLENTLSTSWNDLWDEWLKKTQKRISQDLAMLQAQATTQEIPLTLRKHTLSNDITGVAASPDGNLLAFTRASTEARQGLYLLRLNDAGTAPQNLAEKMPERLNDKLSGVGIAFTPDSKSLVYSRLRRLDIYTSYFDLEVYDLQSQSSYWLSEGGRFRDPHLSPDGKWIVFTFNEPGITGLGLAPLIAREEAGRTLYQLGPVQRIYRPSLYDHVANPKFSPDGEKIYFSFHPHGKSQEDILAFDRRTQKIDSVISDGHYNRFPTFHPNGDLYWISNQTGTDNLFHLSSKPASSPQLATNMQTGIFFPTFGPLLSDGTAEGAPSFFQNAPLYASVFTTQGWGLSQILPLQKPVEPQKVTLASPPLPEGRSAPVDLIPDENPYPTRAYSVFPSLLPRMWTPLLGVDSFGATLGGEVLGFDALDVHRYVLGGSYQGYLGVTDAFGVYSNRSLGPTLNLTSSWLTTSASQISNSTFYTKRINLAASAYFPIVWTYSSLTPAVSFNLIREFNYQKSSSLQESPLTSQTPFLPSLDFLITFSNPVNSSLAIVPEGGRFSQIGTRTSLYDSEPNVKLLLIDQEYIPVHSHIVLVPALKTTWSSRISGLASAGSVLQGRIPQQILGSTGSDSLNQLWIRGYPGRRTLSSRWVSVASLDLYFPILRIFRGWGLNPLFLNDITGNIFIESSYFPFNSNSIFLPSAGAGIKLNTDIFTLPITFSLNFQQGFRWQSGGKSDLFFEVLLGALNF